jgi:hypothetical protein
LLLLFLLCPFHMRTKFCSVPVLVAISAYNVTLKALVDQEKNRACVEFTHLLIS